MGRVWGNTTHSLEHYLKKTERNMSREMMPYAQKIAQYMHKMQKIEKNYTHKAEHVVERSVKHAWKQTLGELGCNNTGTVSLGNRTRYYKSCEGEKRSLK